MNDQTHTTEMSTPEATGTLIMFKSDAAVAAICSPEDSRYVTSAVKVEHGKDDGVLRITATDGRRLLSMSRETETKPSENQEVLLDGSDLRRAAKQCKITKKKKSWMTTNLSEVNGCCPLAIQTDAGDGDMTMSVRVGQGLFPRVDEMVNPNRVSVSVEAGDRSGCEAIDQLALEVGGEGVRYKATDDVVATIRVNAIMLAELLKAVVDSSPDDEQGPLVHLHVPLVKENPVTITRTAQSEYGKVDVVGLVAPCAEKR